MHVIAPSSAAKIEIHSYLSGIHKPRLPYDMAR